MNKKIVLLIDNAGFYFNTKKLQKENSDDSSEDESDNKQESSQNSNKNKRTIQNNSKKISKLSNIKLIYLSPNTTAHLQPIDAEIIHTERWNNVTQKIIRNCWIKTGILPILNNIEIESNNEEETHDKETDEEIDEEIINLLDNLLEKDCVQRYFQLIDFDVSIEENLTEEQIVNLIQFEENEESESDSDDDEVLPVSVKDAISRLKIFIKYFEQQNDNSEFNIDDLQIFRKYL
ncbi:hypothetical protein Glove_406g82 [Diversispora epigaea]|uniref:DDE-1 domain-containing protein n=1 Tax=Diversispora epigaea TaxID=1348612 RepID=A0A397GYY9_9GLOM|nr:hypothetical protein Glove_406g82 [Diversispora epigaea]